MSLELGSLHLLQKALEKLEAGFGGLPKFEPEVDLHVLEAVLMDVAQRMQDNFPYHHPFYIGQMLKPPHPVARLAYMLSLWVNPNNHALDGGRCSSAMEKEAVADIAKMFGWGPHLGHLCGGGTMANLEALWIAGQLHPGKRILASEQAHYTHNRICGVLGIPFAAVPCDEKARMKIDALEEMLEKGNVGTVVVTVGTTATGSVDPLPAILELGRRYGFRIHVDSAYGGYFILAGNLKPETKATYDKLSEVDSIVVDPHKHGLQAYGCGCVIFKDPTVGRYYKHDSPYTYFTSSEMHLGEISLECSRPGASAVALWATHRMLPLIRGGQFAQSLERCRNAAVSLFDFLKADSRFITALEPELDIVIWAMKARTVSEASRLSAAFFDAAASEGLHLAKASLPAPLFTEGRGDLQRDQDSITCLRACLMKPEHLEWMPRITAALDRAVRKIL